uniref:Bulb-type lectin domain-containing protein n=1 Tax=Quercus lobata TaxID=97700 RepID=A0A7N2LTA2_QUELO
MSLLGFAWKLWNVDNNIALIDPMIYEPYFEMEMLRCIHVDLLCVQKFAKDRFMVSVVTCMRKSEIVDIPRPKQPAFTKREKPLKDSSRVLTIFDDGNLIILNGQKVILWSSNVTSPVVNSSA